MIILDSRGGRCIVCGDLDAYVVAGQEGHVHKECLGEFLNTDKGVALLESDAGIYIPGAGVPNLIPIMPPLPWNVRRIWFCVGWIVGAGLMILVNRYIS